MNSWTENMSSGKYLYIEDASAGGGYEAKMAAAVNSPYLIAPAAVFAERKACFEYNISGLISLDEYLTGRNLSAHDMTSLLTQIDTAAAVVQNYLLDETSLLINPKYVYADRQKEELRICVVPEHNGCFEEELKELIMKLLPYTDTDDVSAMRTCIKLMRAVSMPDYRLHDVLEMLNNADIGAGGNNKYNRDRINAYDKGSTAAYDIGQNLSLGRDAYGNETAGHDMSDNCSSNYASGRKASVSDDIYGGADQAFGTFEYCIGDNALKNDIPVNTAFKASETDGRENFAGKSSKEVRGKRQAMMNNEEDQDDENSGSPVKEGITGILISQAILAGIAVMIFFVKGKTVMLRLLPVYAVMAACLIVYHVISMLMKSRKTAE